METQIVDKVALNAQMLRTLFQGRVLKAYVKDLLADHQVSDSIKNGTFRVVREIDTLEHKLLANTEREMFPWLEGSLDGTLMWDMAAINDLILKVNSEEDESIYEEFMTMLTKLLMSVLYTQSNRKKIHFGKYKAMFELIAKELKADTDRQPGLFLYHKEELFVRSGIHVDNQTLKENK